MNALLLIRLINIILITVSVTFWIVFYKKYKMVGVIAPISWLIHVLIYGIYRFVTPETPANMNFMQIWTALIMTHAIILLLVSACMSNPEYPHERKE